MQQSCLRLNKRLGSSTKDHHDGHHHDPEKNHGQQQSDHKAVMPQERSLAIRDPLSDYNPVERSTGSKLKLLKRQQQQQQLQLQKQIVPKAAKSSSSPPRTYSRNVDSKIELKRGHFMQDICQESLDVSLSNKNNETRQKMCSEGIQSDEKKKNVICSNEEHDVTNSNTAVEYCNAKPTSNSDQGAEKATSSSSSDTTVLQSLSVPTTLSAIPSNRTTNATGTMQQTLQPSPSTSFSSSSSLLLPSSSSSFETQLESIYTIAMQQTKQAYQKHIQQMELQYKTQQSLPTPSKTSLPNIDLVNQVTSLQRQVASLQKSLVEMRSKYELEKKRVQSIKHQHKLTMNKLGVEINEKGEVILKLPWMDDCSAKQSFRMDLESQTLGMGNTCSMRNNDKNDAEVECLQSTGASNSSSSSEETVDQGSTVIMNNLDSSDNKKSTVVQQERQQRQSQQLPLQEEEYSPSQIHFSICMDHDEEDKDEHEDPPSSTSSPLSSTMESAPTTAIKKMDGRNQTIRKVTPYASRKDSNVGDATFPFTPHDRPTAVTSMEEETRDASLPPVASKPNPIITTTKPERNLSINNNNPTQAEEEEDATMSSPMLNQNSYKYQEVIRGKKQREKLHGHDCECCKGFYDALLSGKGAQVFNREELIQQNSRHRSRYAQVDSTPNDFWEMSFADSIAERKGKRSASSSLESDIDDDEEEEEEGGSPLIGERPPQVVKKRNISSSLQDKDGEVLSVDSSKKRKAGDSPVDFSQSLTQVEHSIAY